MQYLLDHFAAAIIALVLVVVIMAMQFRTQQVSVDRTAVYMAKTQTLQFADQLTRELSNVGSNMPDDQRIGYRSTNEAGMTDTLQFWRVDSAGDTLNVEYVLAAVDTVAIDDEAVVLYAMKRYSNSDLDGGSPSTLREFRIDLLDDNGQTVGTELEDTRQIRIRMTNVVAYGDLDQYYLPQTYWSTVLRPNTLR